MRLRTKIAVVLACCLSMSAPVLCQQGRREAPYVAVVVNKDVPITNLSFYEVRHIFLGNKQFWNSSLPVVLIVPPAGTREREVMLHSVYGMSESEFKQYWLGRIFSAQATSPPKIADSTATANRLISSVRGCITMMNVSDIQPGDNVKVLTIDGKAPGDKGYGLR